MSCESRLKNDVLKASDLGDPLTWPEHPRNPGTGFPAVYGGPWLG